MIYRSNTKGIKWPSSKGILNELYAQLKCWAVVKPELLVHTGHDLLGAYCF